MHLNVLASKTLLSKIMKKVLKKMMINNSTNINKTRHHLSPQFIEHKFKKSATYCIGNLTCDNVAG